MKSDDSRFKVILFRIVQKADSPSIFVIAYVNRGSDMSVIVKGTCSSVGIGYSKTSVVPEYVSLVEVNNLVAPMLFSATLNNSISVTYFSNHLFRVL